MSHGCHDCGLPNSCECDEIAAKEAVNNKAIDAALATLTNSQVSMLKFRFETERMNQEIYAATNQAVRDIKKKYGR